MSPLAALHLPSGTLLSAGTRHLHISYLHAGGLDISGVIQGDDALYQTWTEILDAEDDELWTRIPAHPDDCGGRAAFPWSGRDRDTVLDCAVAMGLCVGENGWLSGELASYLSDAVGVMLTYSESFD